MDNKMVALCGRKDCTIDALPGIFELECFIVDIRRDYVVGHYIGRSKTLPQLEKQLKDTIQLFDTGKVTMYQCVAQPRKLIMRVEV